MECEVAILLLSLLVVGFMHLTAAHERLVTDMEGWLADEPVYWIAQPIPHRERIVGMPAQLTTAPPPPVSGPPPAGKYSIQLSRLRTTLYPPTASALVKLTEL